MKKYRATIIPTIDGGNIEITICANNVYQAQKLIETLPYFKCFVKQPMLEEENNLTKFADLVKKAQAKHQADLATVD